MGQFEARWKTSGNRALNFLVCNHVVILNSKTFDCNLDDLLFSFSTLFLPSTYTFSIYSLVPFFGATVNCYT